MFGARDFCSEMTPSYKKASIWKRKFRVRSPNRNKKYRFGERCVKFALQIASKNIDLESDVWSLLSKSHKKTSIWRVFFLFFWLIQDKTLSLCHKIKIMIIGRKGEQEQLAQCVNSGQPEFVILYGRRRIGKTYLVRNYFNNQFAFSYVGARNLTTAEQLENYAVALKEYSHAGITPKLGNWREAFQALKELLQGLPQGQRKVVFIDEMPWIDNPHSDFVTALEIFWNGWGAYQNDLLLIACGSATSWMADKLFENQGGLHNRVTRSIYLAPFTLAETEEMLTSIGCHWDRYQILQCYMVTGGVPFYLRKMQSRLSLAQNIDHLFFAKNAELRHEFSELYTSLFRHADNYIQVVKALSEKREGLTRKEITERTKINGGWLTKIIENLERCDFVVVYSRFGSKNKNAVIRLTDMFTLFYLRFVNDNHVQNEQYWTQAMNTPVVVSWQGHTFEVVCLRHLQQIKKALGISGMLTQASCWRGKADDDHTPLHASAQIDLVIERADRIINICEMKFSQLPYTVDADEERKLRNRLAVFQSVTRTRKTLVVTYVTPYGVRHGRHTGIIQSEVTMDDLFA